MKRLGFCFAVVLAWVSTTSAQPAATRRAATAATPPAVFKKYCFECHGTKDPEADLSIERLVGQPSTDAHADEWYKVAEMLETVQMPPLEATRFPTPTERAAAIAWVRASLKSYETVHAGEPGRVTVRRLTSGEYAYAIRDLTGLDLKSGVEASSDSVGGEGFANFGDVQFVQDASIERYLEAAKLVADHAVIGAGPLEFYADPGRTGLELFALTRINEIHATKGFRLVSGEGGPPFGLERYRKAFYITWYYKHRAALGDPAATIRGLAAKEGIPDRFAELIWTTLNKPNTGYPMRETVNRWMSLPGPTADIAASLAKGRAGADEVYKSLVTWPTWFFNRGAPAAGGAGDKGPLVFNDATLKAVPTHFYIYPLAGFGGRGRGAATAGAPVRVNLVFTNLNPTAGVKPVVIWRNPRVVTRAAPPGVQDDTGADPADEDTTPAAVAAAGVTPAVAAGVTTLAETPPAGVTARDGLAPERATPSTQSLRSVLPPEVAAKLGFGTSPDSTVMGPDDFATEGTVSFEIAAPAAGSTLELQADVELGKDKNAAIRLIIANNPEGRSRDSSLRVILADPAGAGYKAFRAGIAEYLSLMPPNSHGEANPADKDPVPLPFDSKYNTPEHDRFVRTVKFQRNDQFLWDYMLEDVDRTRLNQAWNTLFGSFAYHDAYLAMLADHYGFKFKSEHIQDLDVIQINALPADVRPQVVSLRAGYDEVARSFALAEPGQLADALAFASRAWRRPLTAAEKTSLQAFYKKSRNMNGLVHDAAIRALLARILVAPAFLYRVETVTSGAEKPLNGWEMASRMSFFLWSSVPDDDLRRAAAAGELSKPAMLAGQVKRMIADPKARRLATEFFGQWLGFYHFDDYRGIDTVRFPEFTDEVRASMYDEAVSTFEYIVRQERPMKEMLYADYTFINQPLARFYGIDRDVQSADKMELVQGANAFGRGGVLRMGAMLATTSAPLRTSPVKRGDWILRRILGTPTLRPPANAGSIPGDDKAFNGLTLRERLAQHQRNASCAACHLRIDPLGFALEGFDPVGRIRDTYADGKPVDITGELTDKTTIVGADGLLTYLRTQDRQVMKTLSKKMLGYALGRTVLASDRLLIDDMIAAGGDASFSDLAVKIVTSRQFRNHVGDDEVEAGPTIPSPTGAAMISLPSQPKTSTP